MWAFAGCSVLSDMGLIAEGEDGQLEITAAAALAVGAGGAGGTCAPAGGSYAGGTKNVTMTWGSNANTKIMDQAGSGYRVYIGSNHYFDPEADPGSMPGKSPFLACFEVINGGGPAPTSISFRLPSGQWYARAVSFPYYDPSKTSAMEKDINFFIP